MAAQLNSEGVVFAWIADDGSQILGHYMPSTYGAVWDGSKTGALQTFVEKYATGWPAVDGESRMFAPAGGDWAFSQWNAGTTGNWLNIVNDYNSTKNDSDPSAVIGTFPQFMANVALSAGQARTPLLAQNYWTGIFASRPRLKTLHYRAAQRAMAAEAASALLRLASTYSTTTLDDLNAAIDQAWRTLVPSSHHDYITGTSPDRVYWTEQLPMLELADHQAEQCLTRAVGLIAAAVTPASAPGAGTSVVVFNPLGFTRGGMVHLPAEAVTGNVTGNVTGSVATVNVQGMSVPVQPAADGGLLFQVPHEVQVGSFGYTTATLLPGEPTPAPLPPPSDTVTLTNKLVTATLDRSQGWAITSLSIAGKQVLQNGLGNSIRLYEDTGNLYQFGNEPLQEAGEPGDFYDTCTSLTGDVGEWLENGPVRWHFRATVTGTRGESADGQPLSWSYTLDYLLHAGESVLRMRLTGAAPPATSVLTAFGLAPPADPSVGYGLTYGTAHHYDDHQPVPYWAGPTFRSTHDFAQVTGTSGPALAIYHQGVPAWSTVPPLLGGNGQLLGALLRNTDGHDRGAAGTDPGVHTQEYALSLASLSPVTTGDALRTALAVTNPLVAAVVGVNRPTEGVSLPSQASLATIVEPPCGILRLARTHPGSTTVDIPGYYAERSSYALRVYLPATFQARVSIRVPDLPDPGFQGYNPDLTAMVVSALEETVIGGPPITVSDGTVSFTPERALTTVLLTATRCPTMPDTGN